MDYNIEREINYIFKEVADEWGDFDIDGIIGSINRIEENASVAELPILIDAIKDPRNGFWTRELFSGPITNLGGAEYLEELFDALELNFAEGHDNDGFQTHLIDVAFTDPDRCREKLSAILSTKGHKNSKSAEWLIEFCYPEYIEERKN